MDAEILNSWIPGAITFLPLLATIAVFAIGEQRAHLRDALVVLTSAAVLALAVAMYPAISAGKVLVSRIMELAPSLTMVFRVDVFGFYVTLIAAAVWFLVTIYCLGYMEGEHSQTRFYAFYLLTLSGAVGSFMANDLFTLFMFFELMSLPAYVLVIHEQTPQAMRAGVKYLFMTIAGSLAFFFGLVAIQGMTGSLDLNQVGKITEVGPLAAAAFIAFVIAFGMKAGMVPLHVWLSDAHPVAPSPASALLSGVMLKTGVYGLFRVIYGIYGFDLFRGTNWPAVMQVMAAITILLGSAVAITQTDLKRRLAYSSIGQMGYILLAMSLLTERAMVGGAYHIFAHAVVKSCLFLAAGSIIRQTGLRDVRDFGGLDYRMPLTMACFTLCALTIAGIPPMNGFVSEWALMQGAFEAGLPIYSVILMLSALMNAVYYFTIVITAYFSKPRHAEHVGDMHEEHGIVPHVTTEAPPQIIPRSAFQWLREAPPQMLVPMVVLAIASLIFSLIPNNWPFSLAQLSAKLLLGR